MLLCRRSLILWDLPHVTLPQITRSLGLATCYFAASRSFVETCHVLLCRKLLFLWDALWLLISFWQEQATFVIWAQKGSRDRMGDLSLDSYIAGSVVNATGFS